MDRPQPVVSGLRNPENLGRAVEQLQLSRMRDAVRRGDMKEAIEHVLQHRRGACEYPSHLTQIFFKSRHILFGEPVNHPDLAFLFFRKMEKVPEGADFIVSDDPVGLRHFRGERDEGDRKRRFVAALLLRGERLKDGSKRALAGLSDGGLYAVP